MLKSIGISRLVLAINYNWFGICARTSCFSLNEAGECQWTLLRKTFHLENRKHSKLLKHVQGGIWTKGIAFSAAMVWGLHIVHERNMNWIFCFLLLVPLVSLLSQMTMEQQRLLHFCVFHQISNIHFHFCSLCRFLIANRNHWFQSISFSTLLYTCLISHSHDLYTHLTFWSPVVSFFFFFFTFLLCCFIIYPPSTSHFCVLTPYFEWVNSILCIRDYTYRYEQWYRYL